MNKGFLLFIIIYQKMYNEHIDLISQARLFILFEISEFIQTDQADDLLFMILLYIDSIYPTSSKLKLCKM